MAGLFDNIFHNLQSQRENFHFQRRMARARKALAPTEFTHYPATTTQGDANQGLRLSQGEYLLEQDILAFDPDEGIWSLQSPNLHFLLRLHAMDWMDDLAATNTAKSNLLLQQWTFQWIEQYGMGSRNYWTDELVGWRLIRFTTQALRILSGLNEVNQERFFESLAVHLNFLESADHSSEPNLSRFVVATARIFGALALKNYREALGDYIDDYDQLALELVDERFIYLQNRRPDHMAHIFSLLVWCDEALGAEGYIAGRHHDHAIDILGASVRSLRNDDRTLLEAHGAHVSDSAIVDRALQTAQIHGANHDDRVLGYAPVTANHLSAFLDCAAPPVDKLESTAHASTLGLWVSDGDHMIIGAMGSAINHGLQARLSVQETRAHSALTIDEQSSSELIPPHPELGEGALGAVIEEPAKVLSFSKHVDTEATEIWASHDGFLSRYGVIHERRLHIERDGFFIAGVDYLHAPIDDDTRVRQILKRRGSMGIGFQIRFHLGPNIEPSLDLSGQAASFIDPITRKLWVLRQEGTSIEIEDSFYFDSRRLRPAPTKVLVLHSRLVESTGYISWSLQAS